MIDLYDRKAIKLFESSGEALDFMEEYGFTAAQAETLQEDGQAEKAVDVHLSEGRLLDAVHILSANSGDITNILRACRCVLDGLWSFLPLGADIDKIKHEPSFLELVDKARQLSESGGVGDAVRDEVCNLESPWSDST